MSVTTTHFFGFAFATRSALAALERLSSRLVRECFSPSRLRARLTNLAASGTSDAGPRQKSVQRNRPIPAESRVTRGCFRAANSGRFSASTLPVQARGMAPPRPQPQLARRRIPSHVDSQRRARDSRLVTSRAHVDIRRPQQVPSIHLLPRDQFNWSCAMPQRLGRRGDSSTSSDVADNVERVAPLPSTTPPHNLSQSLRGFRGVAPRRPQPQPGAVT